MSLTLCVNNTYFDIAPIPAPEGEVEVRYDNEEHRASLWKGNKRIDLGPIFYKRAGLGSIHPQTGQVSGRISQFRVVFEGNHYDFNC